MSIPQRIKRKSIPALIFSYIEVIYKDGNRHYFYENQTGFDRFEKDFYDKRFTSFHEFWTTEELAEEKRDLFSFRYYVFPVLLL